MNKAKFAWVSVGGSDVEPCVIDGDNVYTIGCPDPFDKNDKAITITAELTPPVHAMTAKRKFEANEAMKARSAKHGWKGWTVERS